MNDSLRMRYGERVRYLNSNGERALELQRFPVYQLPHVAAGNVLHGDEMDIVNDVQIENCANVGVVQRGSQAGLALKAFHVCFFGDKFFRQDLDDQSAAKLGVNGLVDRSLTARTELLENLVIPQCCSYHRFVLLSPYLTPNRRCSATR